MTSEKRVQVTDKVELPRLYMAWQTPVIYDTGDADADLLAEILGGGKSSRLYRKLVYELQIAQDVDVSQKSLALGSVFMITATAKPGVPLAKAGARSSTRSWRPCRRTAPPTTSCSARRT